MISTKHRSIHVSYLFNCKCLQVSSIHVTATVFPPKKGACRTCNKQTNFILTRVTLNSEITDPRIPDRIGIWICWFLRRGENRRTRRKTSRSKDENQQQTQPTFDAESGNRTRATCSTTAPSLLP